MRFALMLAFCALAAGFVAAAIGLPSTDGWQLTPGQESAIASSGAVVVALLGPAVLAVVGLAFERVLGPVTPYALAALFFGGIAIAGYVAFGGSDAFATSSFLRLGAL